MHLNYQEASVLSLSIDHFLTQDPSDSAELVYHYTSRESLKAILETGTIRLNTLTGVNDPRERKKWTADNLSAPSGDMTGGYFNTQLEVDEEIDRYLRQGARIACFTSERQPSPRSVAGTYFHRGWARPRMWAQYGQHHRGAVLAFDKEALAGELSNWALREGDTASPGPVEYFDRRLQIPLSGAFESLTAVRAALDEVTSSSSALHDLYFTKNCDWSSESEFRLVLTLGVASALEAGERPLYLPYRNSLRAVVLGELWDGADWLRSNLNLRRIGADDVLRCDWDNGEPVLRSYQLR
ncbi:DUF2971 domain-containing protein [Kribbella sp. VKM Ac-2568]|uniref:DUF2971 domain-containing protein n=1 Tax=Kribbella sp. VKM Ac-2568 TaxID=2512219 RepID=UPI001050F65A|nr:DUF2971 domain-containing protein [Kribbella sp. VKM Ac-2568]TCM36003.1 DUF2971 family protein [Kribbella sp. VKM Ac-2568]